MSDCDACDRGIPLNAETRRHFYGDGTSVCTSLTLYTSLDGKPFVEVPAKPLHVRVAEALGCAALSRPALSRTADWICGCDRSADDEAGHGDRYNQRYQWAIKRYDTDWSAAGPLIEKYVAQILHDTPDRWVAISDAIWDETTDTHDAGCDITASGRTGLEAVCNLILALKDAGKLNPASPCTEP